MEIVKKYLVFLWRQNGPSSEQVLEEVLETKEGYYFRVSKSGLFQVKESVFNRAKIDTIELMPKMEVKYSQPREIGSR